MHYVVISYTRQTINARQIGFFNEPFTFCNNCNIIRHTQNGIFFKHKLTIHTYA